MNDKGHFSSYLSAADAVTKKCFVNCLSRALLLCYKTSSQQTLTETTDYCLLTATDKPDIKLFNILLLEN